jgi:hypothetical protein
MKDDFEKLKKVVTCLHADEFPSFVIENQYCLPIYKEDILKKIKAFKNIIDSNDKILENNPITKFFVKMILYTQFSRLTSLRDLFEGFGFFPEYVTRKVDNGKIIDLCKLIETDEIIFEKEFIRG